MPMNRLQLLVTVALALLLTGCSGKNQYGAKLPYEAWRLGFLAPNYMEVWIETADVVDTKNRVFKRAMSGVAAIQTPPNLRGNEVGWTKSPGSGAGKHVYGADLPELIYVRWQSLAEQQTYHAWIFISQETRQAMLEGGRTFCKGFDVWIMDHRKNLTIGLAPGGVAKVWIMGTCMDPIEVSRVQGIVVEVGPYDGKSNGGYYRGPNPASQAYIDKYGIPFDSW